MKKSCRKDVKKINIEEKTSVILLKKEYCDAFLFQKHSLYLQ
jgi:hypothetical protein